MNNAATKDKDYFVRELRKEDIDKCYNIYEENHKITDDYFGDIIPLNFPTKTEFTNILSQNKMARGYLVQHAVPLTRNSKVSQAIIDGFVIYEIQKESSSFNVMLVELLEKNDLLVKLLIDKVLIVAEQLGESSAKPVKIVWNIPEDNFKMCKLAFSLDFLKERIIFGKKSDDVDVVVMSKML